jgi:hypothetical protein
MSRSTIVESRRLLAKNWSERIDNGHDDPLTNSRAKIDESRQLLATLDLSPSLQRGDLSASRRSYPLRRRLQSFPPRPIAIGRRCRSRFFGTACGLVGPFAVQAMRFSDAEWQRLS